MSSVLSSLKSCSLRRAGTGASLLEANVTEVNRADCFTTGRSLCNIISLHFVVATVVPTQPPHPSFPRLRLPHCTLAGMGSCLWLLLFCLVSSSPIKAARALAHRPPAVNSAEMVSTSSLPDSPEPASPAPAVSLSPSAPPSFCLVVMILGKVYLVVHSLSSHTFTVS